MSTDTPERQGLLTQFENAARSGPPEEATVLLSTVLQILGGGSGQIPPVIATPGPLCELGTFEYSAAARIAAAMTNLFLRPDWILTPQLYGRLMNHHRWIGSIFAASGLNNCDFILDRLGLANPKAFLPSCDEQQLMKFSLLYGIESQVQLSLTELFSRSPLIGTGLGLSLVTPRLVATSAAHLKREVALNWLPEALSRIDAFEPITVMPLPDIYMHCSYADNPNKHAFKAPLNKLIRQWMHLRGVTDIGRAELRKTKPTIMVILEWFKENHSIMRTHSQSMASLKDEFTLIGIGSKSSVDETGEALFDEYVALSGPILEAINLVRALASVHRPTAVYYPSIGMMPHSLYLMNLRLAPHQFMGLGHPATTHSEHIDYALVEKDYIGDTACFSEQTVALPKGAMPYLKPSMAAIPSQEGELSNEVIKIGIPAYIMKINPGFLDTCASIVRQAEHPVELHFFIGSAIGFMHTYVEKVIKAKIPGALVHPHKAVYDYLTLLSSCHMFLNPFPFGNTNGIIDTFGLRLPGVCLSGPEVHSHIDEGLFKRMGMPGWTIASDKEEYIAAALRLIGNAKLRGTISDKLTPEKLESTVFTGHPERFCKTVQNTIANNPIGERGQ